MLFNPPRRHLDFFPKIKLSDDILEVVESMRLVGLIISDDLSWEQNTDSMVKRAYSKLWILRRLKAMGTESSTLRLVYFRHIRCILEFGVPAWNGAITKKQASKIERVQKVVLHIIYGNNLSYRKLCKKFKLEILSQRRERLCVNFAKKALKNKKFKDWFKVNSNNSGTKFAPTIARTTRLKKAPIPYLTRLLNSIGNV